jgi:hypothetical protein
MAPIPASANGRFPSASQLALDPKDPSHLVLAATFGILESSDAGKTWGWICEGVVGYSSTEDPAIAVTANGTLLAGAFEGLAVSHDRGCGWAFAGGPALKEYVIDTAVEPLQPSHAVAITSTGVMGGFHVALLETLDNGVTFTQAGVDAPKDLIAETVEVAPSKASRVYVSGLAGPMLQGDLERSDDRGKTWTRFAVDLMGGAGAYIAAVDPKNPDRVYLRIDASPADKLLVSDDAGATWKAVHTAKGSMLGFALSPDGSKVAVGGPADGILIASTTDFVFTAVSTVHALCLKWSAEGLYACGDEFKDGFTLARSTDEAKSFAPLYHLSNLAPLACGADTPFASVCPDAWPSIASLIGADDGAGGAGGASQGSSSGSGASAPRATSSGCSISAPPSSRPLALLSALALGAWIHRRNRR